MQGEGLYLAAPNDGYLLLYLSYLRITRTLVIVWVARRPPLMGGTMTYSAYVGLSIPYI